MIPLQKDTYSEELEGFFYNWLMLPSESYEANLAFLDAYIFLSNNRGYDADFTECREYSRARQMAARTKRTKLWKVLNNNDS